jgi:hypothetical protein
MSKTAKKTSIKNFPLKMLAFFSIYANLVEIYLPTEIEKP